MAHPTKPLICITGLTKGIGRALGERFAEAGYRVVGNASSPESVAATKAAHPDWTILPVNMADKQAVYGFAEEVVRQVGLPDVLINNAGRFFPGAIHEEPDSHFEDMMALNLAGPYYLIKALVPSLKTRQTGTVVNICSTASLTAYANGGSYGISKFGLLGLTRNLREELKPHGIRVVAVMPGATYTASWSGAGIPEQRFMRAKDVAEMVFAAVALPGGTVVEELVMRPQLGDIGEND